MPKITLNIDDDVKKILEKRAKKEFLSLKELSEDILRKSAIRTHSTPYSRAIKPDDRLLEAFSRESRGRAKKQKSKF